MAADYKLTSSEPNTPVIRTADGALIPPDESGFNWKEYQRWLADGGVPDPFIAPIGPSEFDWGARFVDIIGRY